MVTTTEVAQLVREHPCQVLVVLTARERFGDHDAGGPADCPQEGRQGSARRHELRHATQSEALAQRCQAVLDGWRRRRRRLGEQALEAPQSRYGHDEHEERPGSPEQDEEIEQFEGPKRSRGCARGVHVRHRRVGVRKRRVRRCRRRLRHLGAARDHGIRDGKQGKRNDGWCDQLEQGQEPQEVAGVSPPGPPLEGVGQEHQYASDEGVSDEPRQQQRRHFWLPSSVASSRRARSCWISLRESFFSASSRVRKGATEPPVSFSARASSWPAA